ncbi:hypothetical protein RMATCC62417_03045 [Rhizopus microsporus]|nr:hypothetical protein RMATCC62417_03045 [Rhizopus microsporus]
MLRLIARQAIRHSAKFRQVPQLVIRQKHAERIIPSIVQLQEDSVEIKLGSESTTLEILQPPTINIGDYVEVFRAGQRSGMVVGQRKMSGRLQMLTVLLRNGRIYTSRSDHVAFVIPSFHKLPEVTKICPQGLSPEINSEGILQTIPVEYQRAITRYQSLVRANKAIAFPRLERLYTQFSQSSSNTVSLNDLTAYAFQTTDITSLQRHVTFSYLAADNVHFTPTNNVLGSEEWKVRSKAEATEISKIITAIRSNDKTYTDFLERARKILEFYKTHADPVLGTLSRSSIDMVPMYSNQLTASDKKFINFIANWIRSPRVVIESPYEIFVPAILKGLKYYDNLFMDRSLAVRFLKEMGMYKPWSNTLLVQETEQIGESYWSERAKENNRKMEEYTKAFLAGDYRGLYSHDACESIRHDFGDLPVYTIDDPSAKEIDDGVSIERIPGDNAWLHVHIADPTTYIPPTHELAQDMQQKVQTVYLPECHFPMLSDTLSGKKFSLGSTAQKNKHGSQYAFTFSAKIDNQGNLLDYKVRPSLVRNVRKIYYDDLDKFLEGKVEIKKDPLINLSKTFSHPSSATFTQNDTQQHSTFSPRYEHDILDILNLADKHTAARTRSGAIAFASPSPIVRILDNLSLPPLRFSKPEYASHLPPIQVSLDKSLFSPARLMVAETMIIGGRIASKFARDNGVNIIYRGQQWRPDSSPEDLRKREELYAARDPITGFVRYQDMIKVRAALPPATFGTTPDQPHVIMGIMDGYTKATSPLRRYGDLIIHWQLKASLLKEKEPFSKDYLDKLLPALEARTKQLSGLQQQSQRFWIMQLLQRMNVDGFLNTMEWDCIIAADNRVALNELGGAIEVADATLLDLGIPVRIDKLKRNVQIGEIAKVRICSVDEGRISAQMIE